MHIDYNEGSAKLFRDCFVYI